MCTTRLRHLESILGPSPQVSETTLDSVRICVWPSTERNHHVNQLTIFFCSLCHCSLTSFLSLSSSFFLARRGWKETQKTPHTQSVSPFVSIIQPKAHFRNASGFFCFVLLDYLHEFVALEYCCGVKYQLAVFNVIFESSHVGLTERHEFLK